MKTLGFPRSLQFIIALFCACVTAFSQTTNGFFQFVQEQSHRHYTQVPHEVLAVYYAWYGQPGREGWKDVDSARHDIANTPHYPAAGPYSSHDPAIIDAQIDLAKSNGITGFAASWWGRREWESWVDHSFPILLERAERKNFKIAVFWEMAPGGGQDQINRAVADLAYVLRRYGPSPAYLKVDGKPVIFVYGRVLSQLPLESWPEIIRKARATAGDFVLIMDGYLEACACLFDGVETYNFAGDILGKNPDAIRTWAAQHYAAAVRLAREHGRISCVTVLPGEDVTKNLKEHGFKLERQDGQTYRVLWDEAIKSKPDWVLLTTWNEWYEATEIEPSLEFGDKYLKITSEFAPRFLAGSPAQVSTPVALPESAPGTRQATGSLLRERTVGVMPDSTLDAQFWLAYCGATVRQLTWSDLIDPHLFNASNFPFVVHAAGEVYTSSVKTTDDVTLSLARYLHEGGFLVSLPVGPWPLHYDASRKNAPYAITDKLALGIDNGFEQPTNAVELTFHAKTNVLFGLPATAPFPITGDLRWRPTNRSRVLASEIYVPLVQLQDNTGKSYGDAVSYIEHRTPSLAGGKSVYVWMRTAEAFGPDLFYPSLYQFISTRLKPAPEPTHD